MRAAVVGHVEWVEFVRVPHTPRSGEIVHATDRWEEAGGGGAATAGQLQMLAGNTTLFTSLGDDELGHRAHDELVALGLRVEAAFRPQPTRRALVHVDGAGERTITVLGERLGPLASDHLPWEELSEAEAVYFTAGDAGALRNARRAKVLVATARAMPVLAAAAVRLDALVASANDPGERYVPGDIEPAPRVVVATDGERGGTYRVDGAEAVRYPAAPLPGPVVDRYGAGDSFAAGLTFALGSGLGIDEAVACAARCGATTITGRGPYSARLDQTAMLGGGRV